MSAQDKPDVDYHESALEEKAGVTEVKTIKGDEAFTQALLKDPPRPWAARSLFLYFACLIGRSSEAGRHNVTSSNDHV